MAEPIFRGVSPTGADAPPRYNVVSPTAGDVLDCTVLGVDVLGVPAHWAWDPVLKKRRSHLCDRGGDCCQFCGLEPLSPLFFTAAWDHKNSCRFVLRLGREGAKSFEECSKRRGKCRGLRVEMYDSTGRYGRELVCVESRYEPLTPLPTAHVIEPIVARLFKVSALPGWLTRKQIEEMVEGGEK